ncbi:hypothetical protein SAY86_006755 [Trapa natans]|uniref:Secreted protein n=1 Tax=Trapa natans TaxID=22666 RepID=A0AAN7LET2_TRANT|nr:hypothetical protein SAY86_006755 [Trapa natans]
MMKMLCGLLIFIVIGGDITEALPKCLPVNAPALQQVAGTLPMFVDELPKMPRVYGYTSGRGHSFKPGKLTIGMFQTQWIVDAIVDFSTTSATECLLNNDAQYPYPAGPSPNLFNGRVMKFIILPGSPNPPDRSSVPVSLRTYTSVNNIKPSLTRHITLRTQFASTMLVAVSAVGLW